MLKWQRGMCKNPRRSQTQKHQPGNDGLRALHPLRHKSAQPPPQGQQRHRKHNRETKQARNKCEKETLCSVVTKLERRRNNTSNRMEHGRNQDGDDKSSHGKSCLTMIIRTSGSHIEVRKSSKQPASCEKVTSLGPSRSTLPKAGGLPALALCGKTPSLRSCPSWYNRLQVKIPYEI